MRKIRLSSRERSPNDTTCVNRPLRKLTRFKPSRFSTRRDVPTDLDMPQRDAAQRDDRQHTRLYTALLVLKERFVASNTTKYSWAERRVISHLSAHTHTHNHGGSRLHVKRHAGLQRDELVVPTCNKKSTRISEKL
jgi:hypothetical protein